MKLKISLLALIVALAFSLNVLAHEGHQENAMGTIAAIDESTLTIDDSDGNQTLFQLTGKTVFVRGKSTIDPESIELGERAVVEYQKEDEENLATEVKLAPSS